MIATKKVANTVGGKTARAYNSCLCKRARWYCPADDAFLCQGCDSAVHSANLLARRHERVQLDKASSSTANGSSIVEKYCPPAWHQGFTQKARTPRHSKLASPAVQPPQPLPLPKEGKISNPLPLVLEIGTEEGPHDGNENQLLYRVPVFDPFAADSEAAMGGIDEACGLDNYHRILLSDVDLAEFAADVESLLGTGLDEEMELGLGLMSDYCKEEEEGVNNCSHEGRKVVKVEEDEDGLDTTFDLARETMNWNFDSEAVEEEEKIVGEGGRELMNSVCKEEVERKRFLRLNYEGVITAWASHGSPWTTGIRPEFNPNDCWPDFMGLYPVGSSHPCIGMGGDGGREARVSRYRKKRRTRLFSKKIRYEVRKLNAEKRPRMKGRFVKRSSFAAGHNFPYLMNK